MTPRGDVKCKSGYFGGREEKQRDQKLRTGRDLWVPPGLPFPCWRTCDRHRHVFHFPDPSCLLSLGKVTVRDLQDVFVSKKTSCDMQESYFKVRSLAFLAMRESQLPALAPLRGIRRFHLEPWCSIWNLDVPSFALTNDEVWGGAASGEECDNKWGTWVAYS